MDGTSPNFDNAKVVETLNFINDLKTSGAMAPGFASRTGGVDLEEFIAGRSGFIISPGVHASAVATRNPDLNYDLVRVPTNGVNAYRVHGWELGIASKSKHKEEAWKFIDFLLSKEVNAKVAKASRALPGNLDSIDLVSGGATPVMKTQMNILSGDEPVEELRQAPSAVASWSIMTEEMQSMLNGDQSAKEAASKVQSRWLDLIS